MMSEAQEAYPEAAAILRDAGWAPHDQWGVYTRGTLVMGLSPDGQNFDVKNWGLDIHGPDTPDDPVEAAQWLVALRTPVAILTTEATLAPPSEPEQDSGHEGDGETGAEAQGEADESVSTLRHENVPGGDDGLADTSGERDSDHGGLGDAQASGGLAEWASGEGYSAGWSDSGSEERGRDYADPLDADFTEDPLLEFGGEVLEEHPEEHGSGAFIFGDNLEQQRTAAIGIVVRISRGKQADIRALMGDADFAQLQGYVLRDTIDGVYRGPPETYATFVELSRHQSAINRVKYAEADKVEFLDKATRADLEAFNPEADWPE